MSAVPRVAVVGAGPMGTNHARVVAESDAACLALVVDVDEGRGRALADRLGCAYAADIASTKQLDAAVIATPTALHELHALPLLEAGVPLLVEKPVTPCIESARRMVECAERTGTPLMCGFVERFSPAVTTVASLLDGPPRHVVSLRHSPATPRSRLSVVLDLLIHDIDLALRYMGGELPAGVCAAASSADGIAEVADCILRFGAGMATLSASRSGQRKVRTQLITAADALYDVDLLRQDITVYRHRGHEASFADSLSYRAETVIDIPFVRHGGEPLALQLRHFLGLVEGSVDACAERAGILPAHEVAAAVEAMA